MKSTNERISLMHERAKELKRKKDRAVMIVYSAACIVLFCGLIGLIRYYNGQSAGVTGDMYTASSLIAENVGGYVLVAVFAFSVGVIFTVLCVKWRGRNGQSTRPETPGQNHDGDEKKH